MGIVLVYDLTQLRPYEVKIRKLHDKKRFIKNNFKENSIAIPITKIIDYIKVYGDKIVIPPLGNIDDCYYYDPYFHTPLDDDTHQIFMLEVSHFWEEYYLTARFSGKYELTYDEYKLLKSKDLENI